MGELLALKIREMLAVLVTSDAARKRFGASHHRYQLAPPLDAAPDLPGDLQEFATLVGSAGAGPYYGLLSLATPRIVDAPSGQPWKRAIAVGHMGCGYAAVVPLDGTATGTVWIDARAIGVVRQIQPNFHAYYLDWLHRLARNAWPESYVPPSACALPNALGGFLGLYEQRHGIPAHTLAGEPLRAALGELGPGAIAIAADGSVLYPDGTRVDPCIGCARLVENLVADGLDPRVVAPGSHP